MPPGEHDRPSDPPPFGEDEPTVPNFEVDVAEVTTVAEERSRVVARPPAPVEDDLDALDALSADVGAVDVDWEIADWDEEEATVSLSDHQLTKLRAAAASDEAEVFAGPKRPRRAPPDPSALPLPPVLDPELE